MPKNTNGIFLRGYEKGDEKQISHLFYNNFPDTLEPELIRETWLWQFKNIFSKYSCVSVAELSNEIVAHYAVMWFPMCYQGDRIDGAVSTATVTDVKARGKGLFTKLAKKVFAETEKDNCKIIFGFPNSQSIRGFINRLEWFEVEKFPVLIKPVNFFPFLRKFLGENILTSFVSYFMKIGFSIFFKLLSGWGQDKDIKIILGIKSFSGDFDTIWDSSFASSKIAVARDQAYLKWRYLDKPFGNYDIVTAADENNELVGFMITAMTEKKGIKVLYVMEIMAKDENRKVYKKFLKYLETNARDKSADAISMLSLPNNANMRLFYKHGFLPVPRKLFPQDIHFCARVNSGDIDRKYVADSDNWFITWGDLDIV